MYLTYNYPYSYLSHQDEDLDRTVGINTCYVGTSDFELEEADKDYVISVSSFLYDSLHYNWLSCYIFLQVHQDSTHGLLL